MTRSFPGAKLLVTLATLLVACVAAAESGASANTHQLTIYARATHVQYVSHSDDRVRGDFTNPFNSDTTIPPPKDNNGGALPGDNALFTFKLFSDRNLKRSIGSATYSCTFNFSRNAVCEADFTLDRGTILATGQLNFNAEDFTLVVISGTGAYLGTRGQVSSSPSTANSHRLAFRLA